MSARFSQKSVPAQPRLRGDIWVQFKAFLRCWPGWLLLAATALLSNGYAATHTAIGVDDTPAALERYFDTGELILSGRISPFLFHRLLPGYTYNTVVATVVTTVLLALAGLVFAALLYAAQGRRADSLGFILPAALLSYPLLAEILMYMQQQIGIGVGFLAAALGTAFLAEHILYGRVDWALVPGVVLVAYAVGDYEAFAAVYLTLFLALLAAWQWAQKTPLRWRGWLAALVRGVWPLAAALALKSLLARLLTALYAERLAGLTVNAAQHVKWLENGLENFPATLASLIGGLLVDYFAMAFASLPMTLLFAGFVLVAGWGVVRAVRGGGACQLLTALALCASQFALSFLQGQPQYTRASECFAVFCAFALWLAASALWQGGRWRRGAACALTVLVLAGQGCVMDKTFRLDAARWQYEQSVLADAAQTLQNYDTTKPVVFTGRIELPQALTEQNIVPSDNWAYKVSYLCSLLFDQPNSDLYYSANALPSVINWSLDAFGYPQTQIYSLFALMDVPLTACTLTQQTEALETAADLPHFPQQGSVVDCGEYIIFNF